MGLFGGGNSSSSNQTQANTTVKNIGSSNVSGIALASDAGNVTLNSTDAGAVSSAFNYASDVAKQQANTLQVTQGKAFDFGSHALDLAAGSANNALYTAQDAIAAVVKDSQSAQQNVLAAANQGIAAANPNATVSQNTLYVAIAAFAVLAFLMVKR